MIARADLLTVLLVEDNAGDVYMVREALEEAGCSYDLHVVDTGIKAMDFLYRRGQFSGSPRPDLVILDLNLPGKPGQEVMAEMEASPELKDVPVAVLTTSRSSSDICQRYPGLRSMFAAKTPLTHELIDIMKRFDRFARSRK
ncbi:MAG: response regulator [Phycisphaerae bacterium]